MAWFLIGIGVVVLVSIAFAGRWRRGSESWRRGQDDAGMVHPYPFFDSSSQGDSSSQDLSTKSSHSLVANDNVESGQAHAHHPAGMGFGHHHSSFDGGHNTVSDHSSSSFDSGSSGFDSGGSSSFDSGGGGGFDGGGGGGGDSSS